MLGGGRGCGSLKGPLPCLPECLAASHGGTAYNRPMSKFWTDHPQLAAAVIGLLIGLLANKGTEYWARFRSYRVATRLKGKWTAHNMTDGRHVNRQTRMHDRLTKIEPRPWYRACCSDSHILDVSAEDPDGRHHSGPLVIDPVCSWFATRIVLYSAMDEISEQRVMISPDRKTLYVFPLAAVSTLGPGYRIHALCKQR